MKRFSTLLAMVGVMCFTLMSTHLPVLYAETGLSGYENMAKITVTSEIKRVLSEKDAGLLSGTEAIRTTLKEMQKQVQSEIAAAGVGSWDAHFLPDVEAAIKEHIDNWGITANAGLGDTIDKTWASGINLVNAPLVASGELVIGSFGIPVEILNVMKDFTFHKLDGVKNAAWDKIRSELTLGVLGGKTPHEVATAIGKNLTSPSIFKSIHDRANVITNTELSRVFDKASHEQMKTAAAHVDGLKKQWRHDGHPKKPRSTHVAAHNQVQLVEEYFIIGSVEMMFPHDPAAPIGEVINCTCTQVPYMDKWAA